MTTSAPITTEIKFSRDVSTIEVADVDFNFLPLAGLTDGTIALNDSDTSNEFSRIQLDSIRLAIEPGQVIPTSMALSINLICSMLVKVLVVLAPQEIKQVSNGSPIVAETTIVEVMTSSQVKTLPASWFTIFPVPATEVLNINNKQSLPIQFLQIMDSQGRLLNRLPFTNQLVQQNIDISTYPTGTYFLQIFTKEGFLTKKFLIKDK